MITSLQSLKNYKSKATALKESSLHSPDVDELKLLVREVNLCRHMENRTQQEPLPYFQLKNLHTHKVSTGNNGFTIKQK